MSTNFPTSLDALSNPAGTDQLASPSHAAQHTNANDAIEAIEAKLGTGASTPAAATWMQGTGAGTSGWLTAIGTPIFGATISPTALAGNTNNWIPTNLATAYFIRASASTPVDLTGIAAATEGRELFLVNTGASVITLKHNSANSGAGNKFLIHGATDLALATWGQVRMFYSATDGYWLVK